MSLNLLAFLFHTVLDLVNYTYQKIRELLVTRTTFFKDIRTLLKSKIDLSTVVVHVVVVKVTRGQ